MLTPFRAIPFEIKLAEGAAGEPAVLPKEVQLLRVGTFHDPRYGKVNITKDHLRSMVKNFDERVRGIDIAFDFGHATEGDAAGWMKSVQLREGDTQLWAADVEWSDVGAEKLRGKRLRYSSADFHLDYQDNESLKKHGPTLLGAGLTNRPVVKRMSAAIALTEFKEGDSDMKTIEELQAEVTKLSEENTALKAQSATAVKFSEAFGTETPEAVKLKLSESEAKVTKLETEKAEAQKAAQLAEQKGKFDKMLSEGKACEAQREAYMAGDVAKFAELQQPIKLSENGKDGAGTNEAKNVAEAQAQILKLAEKAVEDKKAVDVTAAISLVLSEPANKKLADLYNGR